MTMTHSSEVSNVKQEPGPTDMRARVMILHKNNRVCLYALLSKGESWYSVTDSVQSHA